MKVYYVNDETVDVTIRVIGIGGNNQYIRLAKQESILLEFQAPEGSVPYVKRWDNHIVLVSYIGATDLENIERTRKP